jgi:hypothetical protein
MVVHASPVGYGYHRLSVSGRAQVAPATLSTRGVFIIDALCEEIKGKKPHDPRTSRSESSPNVTQSVVLAVLRSASHCAKFFATF